MNSRSIAALPALALLGLASAASGAEGQAREGGPTGAVWVILLAPWPYSSCSWPSWPGSRAR